MAMVNVDGSSRRTHRPSRLAWSEGWRPPGAQSAFMKWNGWTLAVTVVMRTAPYIVGELLLLIIIHSTSTRRWWRHAAMCRHQSL